MKPLLYALRRHLPRTVRRQLHRVGTFFGDEFVDRSQQFGDGALSIGKALARIRDWGFQPHTIVDVGAYRGDWTRLVKSIFPDASVLMVEAQASLRPVLATVCSYYPDVAYRSALLAAVSLPTVEFVEMATGSSVLEERSSVPRIRVAMPTSTLDDVADALELPPIELLKIDVQGYELEILKGAIRRLPSCEFVLLESSLIPINRGCPLIAEVFAFMSAQGFRLLDICSEIRRKDGALWQTDLLFVNESSRHVPVAELNGDNW